MLVPSCKSFPVVQDPQSLAVNQLWKSCDIWMIHLTWDSLSHSLRAAVTSRLPLPCPNLDTSATMAAILLMGKQLRDKVPTWFWVFGRDLSHRWDLKGPLESTQSNPPAIAGPSRPGCTGWCPGGFWITPEKETSQSLWRAAPGLCHPQNKEVFFLIFR